MVGVDAECADATFPGHLLRMAQELRSAPKAEGVNRIYMPGEMEWDKREKALAENRLELTDVMASNLEKLSAMTGVAIEWL